MMENKVIRLCADPFPPYQFLNQDGYCEGSDFEWITELLRKAGYRSTITIDDWNVIFPAFEEKKYDAIFQVQYSREREETFFLSDCFRRAETEILTLKQEYAALDSYEALAEKSVGVIAGFTNGVSIDSLPLSCKWEYIDAKSVLQALFEKNITFAVMDKGVKEYLLNAYFQDRIKELYELKHLSYYRPMHVMFHDEIVRDAFNQQLRMS